MKVNRNYKPKSFKRTDNYNIDYQPYYTITGGVYKFYDKLIRNRFMYLFGIMCQAERKMLDNKLTICYNGVPMTGSQKEFLRKRALALEAPMNIGVPYDCKCKKNKRPQ